MNKFYCCDGIAVEINAVCDGTCDCQGSCDDEDVCVKDLECDWSVRGKTALQRYKSYVISVCEDY